MLRECVLEARLQHRERALDLRPTLNLFGLEVLQSAVIHLHFQLTHNRSDAWVLERVTDVQLSRFVDALRRLFE